MGAAVIAVVFVAGLLGAPTMFGHGEAHAKPQVQQVQQSQQEQVASVQVPAQSVYADADASNAHP